MGQPQELYQAAKKEMIRADHLLFVSLKYSRTVDVIQSVIKRLIEAIDICIQAVLHAKLKGDELEDALHGAKTKTDAILKIMPDAKEYIEFFQFLRKLEKAPVLDKLNEYRRHVTLVTEVEGEPQNIKIETCAEYFNKAQEFLAFAKSTIED